MPRTIVFGDIHGCHEEWEELLKKVKAGPEDKLISVGDLVFKGPSTKKVLDKAMAMPNLKCVLGNHEAHLLRIAREIKEKGSATYEKPYQKAALEELGKDLPKYVRYIESWPLYIDLPECLVIHAGLRPEIPLEKQSREDLTRLRTIEPSGKAWYEFYKGKKLVVHGHWAAQGLVVRENVISLDSGCVYGRALSCVVLPGRQIISVPAQKAYSPVGKD